MTLRKDDISIINRLSSEQAKNESLTIDDIVLYENILKQSASWTLEDEKSLDASFEEILNQINTRTTKKPNAKGFNFLSIAASMALTIISVFAIYFYIDSNSISAELGEIKTIYLPDSSKVVLNAASNISYSTSNWDKGNRLLELEGQAYFEVKKGSQFQVQSKRGIVSVLGTSFNIYDRGDDYKVECFTGKVSVESTINEEKVYLTKGLKTGYNVTNSEGLNKPVVFNESKSLEWTNGIFNFYNTPLAEVFEEVERQFNIEVEYIETSSKYYTGTFNKNSLENTLINICKPMGYEYELKEDILLIINN